jgi:hypothetical protein
VEVFTVRHYARGMDPSVRPFMLALRELYVRVPVLAVRKGLGIAPGK